MIRYNPQGMHYAELFATSLSDLLPAKLPTKNDPDDAWDEELMAQYAHDIGKE